MAKIKNLNDAIVRLPETAGSEIQRKSPVAQDANLAAVSPKTAAAPPKGDKLLAEPFAAKQSDARQAARKTPRPTNISGE